MLDKIAVPVRLAVIYLVIAAPFYAGGYVLGGIMADHVKVLGLVFDFTAFGVCHDLVSRVHRAIRVDLTAVAA